MSAVDVVAETVGRVWAAAAWLIMAAVSVAIIVPLALTLLLLMELLRTRPGGP